MNYTKPVKYNSNPITSNRSLKKAGHNLLMSFSVPIVFTLIAIFLAQGSGGYLIIDNFGEPSGLIILFRSIVLTLLAATALNTNLNSGRMDFALGATGMLGAIIADKVNDYCGNTITSFILLTITFSMVLGLIHGLIYIALKLPPIVVSLGMCLIYEGIGKIIVPKGTAGQTGMAMFNQSYLYLFIVFIAVAIFMSVFLCYSKFGYEKNALVYDQRVSVETGIREVRSCIICYIVAGMLIGLYQALKVGDQAITPSVDLGSSGTVFNNFLPIFIGGILAKYNNQIIGLSLAIYSTEILKLGLNCASEVRFLGIDEQIIKLITGFMVFGVLVYMVDKNRFINWVKMRRYISKEKYLNPSNLNK